MATTNDTFKAALSNLLVELFNGPPGSEAFVLNPGDPGLLKQLESVDAATASRRAFPGKTTIAAHVDHVNYGISLLNRWAAGEANPWADADWDASWKRGVVNDDQWRTLRNQLAEQVATWQKAVAKRQEWDALAAGGAIASAAHSAYHLGAIRQILAGNKP